MSHELLPAVLKESAMKRIMLLATALVTFVSLSGCLIGVDVDDRDGRGGRHHDRSGDHDRGRDHDRGHGHDERR